MKITDFNKHSKQGKRLWEIIRILRRYRIGDWFKGIPVLDMPEMMRSPEIQEMRDRPVAARRRFAMTEMGTTFIKLGQILSTRAALVGPEAAAEL